MKMASRNQKVFTVYDSKVEAFLQPFVAQNKASALRSFMDACKDPKTQFAAHPGDFTLFEIAEYDEWTGTLLPHPAKINLGCALEFVTKLDEPSNVRKI